MGFFTPWFLGGLLAVGLPVWLHLLKRHRTTPLPFSSLMFFERRVQSSIKHRRLRYLLLFALRAALVALLALAFAKPYVKRSMAPAIAGEAQRVIAVDSSFSMRTQGRMEKARAAAARLVGSGKAQVVAFDSQAHLMGDATTDASALRASIAAIQPSDARGSFAELARAVRSIAQNVKTPVELHVISDMQNTGLPASFADLRLGEGVRLVPHAVDKPAPNWTVESVRAPRRVYSSAKVKIQATVSGFATPKATRRASLSLNGRMLETRTVEVVESGRATVEFQPVEIPHGLNRGEIRIDGADVLREDDIAYFAVDRGEARRVLFVQDAAASRALLYFRTALEAPAEGAFQIDAATVDQSANLAASKYAFVVLSDTGALPASFEKELRNYVRGGGGLLVALGRRAAAAARVPVFDEKVTEARYSGREGERFQTAAWLDSAHPSVGGDGRWSDVRFYQTVRVESGPARVAARLSDQTPLLMEKRVGEGRVLVFASTFDNVANDFPVHASFVPFVEQTARYLARLDEGQASFQVGAYLDLRAGEDGGGSVEVITPRGARAFSLGESATARNIQLAHAGFYEVHRASRRDELVAVNADRRESDLAAIPAETLALWENTGQSRAGGSAAAATAEEGGNPVSLWWYVMLALAALAVAESILGNRHLGVDKEAA
jgi:hypothetical protein